MHLEALRVWTWRPYWSLFGDTLGGKNLANLHTVIQSLWWFTWRPWLRKFGDALGGCDGVSVVKCILEAMLLQTWKTNWMSLEIHVAVFTEHNEIFTWRWLMHCMPGSESLFMSLITCNQGNMTRWHYLGHFMECWLMAFDCVGKHAGN